MSTPGQRGAIMGGPSGSPIPQARDRGRFDTRKPFTLSQTYRDLYDGWLNRAPYLGSPLPACEYYYLKTIEYAQLESNGLFVDVTLIYEWNVAFGPTPNTKVPPTLVDENDGLEEVPLEMNPNFEDGIAGTPDAPLHGAIFDPLTKQFQGFAPGSIYYGVEKFGVGTLSVSVTQYAANEPFASIDDIVGTLAAPGFDFDSDPDNWLIVSGHRGKQGAFFTLTTVYKYSSIGYPPDVYDYADDF